MRKLLLLDVRGKGDAFSYRGVNTHKGAIWAIGLLTSARAVFPEENDPYKLMEVAGEIASFQDRYEPALKTHGQEVKKKYRIISAKDEAQHGFPMIQNAGLPALLSARKAGKSEQEARIESLLALMASVDDTCILHRGKWSDLIEIKRLAKEFLLWDGFGTSIGRKTFDRLTEYCESRKLSPGGSADLLAATLFLIS